MQTKRDRTTVGRLVRVLKQLNEHHDGDGHPRFTIHDNGDVVFLAWDTERDCEVRQRFANAAEAAAYYEKYLAENE